MQCKTLIPISSNQERWPGIMVEVQGNGPNMIVVIGNMCRRTAQHRRTRGGTAKIIAPKTAPTGDMKGAMTAIFIKFERCFPPPTKNVVQLQVQLHLKVHHKLHQLVQFQVQFHPTLHWKLHRLVQFHTTLHHHGAVLHKTAPPDAKLHQNGAVCGAIAPKTAPYVVQFMVQL